MKLVINLFIFIAVVFATAGIYAVTNYSTKELAANEAIQKWGYLKFDSKQFKSGDHTMKSKMASDLLNNNPYSGKPVSAVWEDLGYHDGHFKNDVVPAYILNEDENDVWQLVFLLDENRIVTKTAIYKNCCEK